MIEYKTINNNNGGLYAMKTLKNGNQFFYFDDFKGLIAHGTINHNNTANITIINQHGYIDRFRAIKKDLKKWCNCNDFIFNELKSDSGLGYIDIIVRS